jgi:hypothetical protein
MILRKEAEPMKIETMPASAVRNRNRPINRFEIQIVFDDGAYVRLTGRKHPPLSRAEVFTSLRDFLRDFDKGDTKPSEPATATNALDPVEGIVAG